jgi:ComF family protein
VDSISMPWAGASRWRGVVGRAHDLLLPPRALDEAGGGSAVQSAGLTADAWTRITFIEAPFCDGCGAPFEYDMGALARCAACQGRKPAFDRARAACLYDDNSRDLILKLKHADRTDLAGLFARWIARASADILPELDAVVPVPLHRWRLLGRRYNQAAEIARPLARDAGLAYLPDALVRARATKSQSGKSGSGRRRNVAGAFAAAPAWRGRIAGRRLLLIDDVLTTGATLESCARALKSAGAARVDVAVIARVKEMAGRAI